MNEPTAMEQIENGNYMPERTTRWPHRPLSSHDDVCCHNCHWHGLRCEMGYNPDVDGACCPDCGSEDVYRV